ncbi:MAG: glycosyltransferase [Candidatus Staskawiczbacteria bacterium]|nr:glycosyltransferase [Candidatus Staskawiczbacteria bacterium]
MNNPLVSVIIPTHNRKEYLAAAIRSVFAQTYKEVEVIVVDDHSTDGTLEALADFVGITVIRNEKNMGPAGAANRGILASSGKYIAMLDDDDQWNDHKKLQKQVDFLEKNEEYVLAGGGVVKVNEEGVELLRYLLPESDKKIRSVILANNVIAHSAIVFRKEAWQKAGGYPERISFGDWALWLELGRFGKFYNFQEFFIHYTDHGASKSKRYYDRRKDFWAGLEVKKKYSVFYSGYIKAVLFHIARYTASFLPAKDPSIAILVFMYRKIFKEDISSEVFAFIKNLRFMIVGGFLAAVLGIVFQSLAGRILGPAEYGKYILINSITVFLGIPMLFGVDQAMLKYNSEKTDNPERQKKILSTTLIIFFVLSLFFGSLFFACSPFLARIFSVSTGLFNLAIVLTFSIFTFTLSAVGLQSFHKIKESAIIKLIQKALMLVIFSVMVFMAGIVSYVSAVVSLAVSSVIIFLLVAFYLRKYIGFYFDRAWAKKLVHYGSYGVFSSIAGAVSSNFDKIVINHFLSPAEIGLYGAYSAAFVVPIFFLFGMFNAVFYPTVSRRDNKMSIFHKVNRTIPLMFSAMLVFVMASGFFILMLYGKDYPFNITLGILFAILAMLMCLAGAYGAMMGSVGRRGVRVTTMAGIALMVVNIVLDFLLIPVIGLAGAALSLIIAYIVNVLVVYFYKDYFTSAHD